MKNKYRALKTGIWIVGLSLLITGCCSKRYIPQSEEIKIIEEEIEEVKKDLPVGALRECTEVLIFEGTTMEDLLLVVSNNIANQRDCIVLNEYKNKLLRIYVLGEDDGN